MSRDDGHGRIEVWCVWPYVLSSVCVTYRLFIQEDMLVCEMSGTPAGPCLALLQTLQERLQRTLDLALRFVSFRLGR